MAYAYCTYSGGTGTAVYPASTFTEGGGEPESGIEKAYRQMVASKKHPVSGNPVSWAQLLCGTSAKQNIVDSYGIPASARDPQGQPIPGTTGTPAEDPSPGTRPKGFFERNKTFLLIGGGLAVFAYLAVRKQPARRRRRR